MSGVAHASACCGELQFAVPLVGAGLPAEAGSGTLEACATGGPSV